MSGAPRCRKLARLVAHYERPGTPGKPMQKQTILFLAVDSSGIDADALQMEARAIQQELDRAGYRECFDFQTRWAAEPLDLLRHLRTLRPAVVHFSGRGEPGSADDPQGGLVFRARDGGRRVVSADALRDAFAAAGSSVKLVVLNACYSEPQAEALLAHVDYVVGMAGSIGRDAARSFAIGFYGGLGEREPVSVAYQGACAAISLDGFDESDRPRLKVRDDVDTAALIQGVRDGAVLMPAKGPHVPTGRATPRPTLGSYPSTVPSTAGELLFTWREVEFAAIDSTLRAGRVVVLQREPQLSKSGLAPEIFQRHRDYLRARACNLTGDPSAAGDLVQSALTLAQENLAKFEQGTNARAWLTAILTHLFLDGLKHERVFDRALPKLILLSKVEIDTTLLDIPDAYLYSAIDSLDPLQRLLIERRYRRSMSHREIAELLGVTVGTVDTQLLVTHRRLKEFLSQMIEKAPWT
jgi:RNA polymerase sigma factor (sigma-70 family)